MYLLKLSRPETSIEIILPFTFHYVSIKTFSFLYEHNPPQAFTFHYVSIKTLPQTKEIMYFSSFTFHYVSIKTRGLK